MSQVDDYSLGNLSFPVARARLNDLFAAIRASNAGPTAPPNPAAGMTWFDTSVSPAVLRQRSGDNTTWLRVAYTQAEVNAKLAPFTGRNLVINGSGRINQRVYASGTATGAANQYTLDRWRVVVSGQSLTFTGDGSRRVMTAPAGGVEQVVEGLNIVGGSYVLNWDGTATATVGGVARAKGEVFTLTANTNVTIRFTGGTFTDVQLESGLITTPFEQRSFGQELALCQRFYQISGAGSGWSGNTTTLSVTVGFFTRMRAAPSVTIANGTNALLDPFVAIRNISTIQAADSYGDLGLVGKIDITTPSTTANKVHLVQPGAFAFSAEL